MIPAVCWYFNVLQNCIRNLWWFLVWLFSTYSFMLSGEGGGRMDEKDFLEFLIAERMVMHHENFQKEYPPTEEQAAEAEKADQAHELLFQQLSAEQRAMMELCEDVTNSDSVRENEYYYRAGFRDGVSFDKLIKQIREENK